MMEANLPERYERIRQFSIDDGDEHLTFAARLVRENNWSPAYAERVIEEYKKFAFLAVAAGHPVSPSDQVDQVWHMHLTYTESYWNRFCHGLLHVPLHHHPTKGGATEGTKFLAWYSRTLESYRRVFEHEPPPDIWPDASIRFGDDLHFMRINTKRHWVIAKPRLRGGKIVLIVLMMLVLCTVLLGIKMRLGGDHSWAASTPSATQSLSASGKQSPAVVLARGTLWPIILIAPVLILAILAAILGNGCPQCNRRRALEKLERRSQVEPVE